jgi:hypothetical protein
MNSDNESNEESDTRTIHQCDKVTRWRHGECDFVCRTRAIQKDTGLCSIHGKMAKGVLNLRSNADGCQCTCRKPYVCLNGLCWDHNKAREMNEKNKLQRRNARKKLIEKQEKKELEDKETLKQERLLQIKKQKMQRIRKIADAEEQAELLIVGAGPIGRSICTINKSMFLINSYIKGSNDQLISKSIRMIEKAVLIIQVKLEKPDYKLHKHQIIPLRESIEEIKNTVKWKTNGILNMSIQIVSGFVAKFVANLVEKSIEKSVEVPMETYVDKPIDESAKRPADDEDP